MSWLGVLKDIFVIIGPLILEIVRTLKDRELRSLQRELQDAKTKEDRLAVAAKFSQLLYNQ